MKKEIHHVVTGLDVGGAELMLSELVTRGAMYRHSVTSLTGIGPIGEQLSRRAVRVEAINIRKDPSAWLAMNRFCSTIKHRRPALVQTWLYHADLAGGIAARRAGVPLVWNLRQTDVEWGVHKLTTRIVIRACALLSKYLPSAIVCVSDSARAVHARLGFDRTKLITIPNGVDTSRFTTVPEQQKGLKAELRLAPDSILVGRVGRFHPQKDYKTFVDMAARLAPNYRNVVFVMVGRDVSWSNSELRAWIESAGIRERAYLLGERNDIPSILGSLDVAVSSSSCGEGFPNVVAEAMSCGVPVVATNIGDSGIVVNDTERIVEPHDVQALVVAVARIIDGGEEYRKNLGFEDRQRIVNQFNVENMVKKYEALYEGIINKHVGDNGR